MASLGLSYVVAKCSNGREKTRLGTAFKRVYPDHPFVGKSRLDCPGMMHHLSSRSALEARDNDVLRSRGITTVHKSTYAKL